MIKNKALPVILRVISKLDAKPIIQRLKGLDFSGENGLTNEEIAVLGSEILAEILPQLGKIEADIIPLIASVKDISEKEAAELPLLQSIKDLFSDEDLVSFFKSALTKKAER